MNARFVLRLSARSGKTVTVLARTRDGTALAPSDYIAKSVDKEFPPGTNEIPVIVSVNGDSDAEPDESFFVRLLRHTNATIADGSGRGRIDSDD